MKVAVEGVSYVIEEARKVVKTWYIAVEPLINAKQPQEICWRGVSGGTTLALPESGVKVVALLTMVHLRVTKVWARAAR